MGFSPDTAPAMTGRSKTSTNFRFDALNSSVTIKDADFVRCLYITNLNSNEVMYNVTDEFLGGTVDGIMITVDFDTSGMDDTDSLLVIYDSKDLREDDILLRNIYDELRENNKLLKKILKH